MKLSVIIPVYKTEGTLARCVESIIAQTFTDWEAILVDDGSPDSCPLKCDDYASRDKRIKVIHKVNGGLSDARNKGICAAAGEWITFVDSDDHVSPDTFEAVMDAISCNPETDMVEYPLVRHEGREDESWLTFSTMTYHDTRAYWLRGKAYLHTYACNKVIRRSMMQGVLFPYGKKFEDAWMLPELLRKNPVVMTIDKGLYHYTWNDSGITANADGHDLLSLLEAQLAASDTLGISLLNADSAAWYMSMLNTQIDVCRMLKTAPILPARRLPLSVASTMKERLKICILNLLGQETLLFLIKAHKFQ